MINPPRNGSNQLSAWLNPKGETEGVTQQERERGRGRQRRGKKSLFSSLLLSGCHRSTGHDSSSWLPALVSPPLFPSTFIFSRWWENVLLAFLSCSLFYPSHAIPIIIFIHWKRPKTILFIFLFSFQNLAGWDLTLFISHHLLLATLHLIFFHSTSYSWIQLYLILNS